MQFRFSIRYLCDGQLYADETTATNLLAVEKLTGHHLPSSPTYDETKTKKKAATGLCVQCKFCFKLGNERPAWPSQKLACHPGYVFFQVVVDHMLPLHRWEQKTRTCWELGLLVLSLVCVNSCHASDSCLGECICPPFMGICWTGGRQVP